MYRLLVHVGFLLCAASVQAKVITYECNYSSRSAKNWVAPIARYYVDDAKSVVLVYDGYVSTVSPNKPLAVSKVEKKNNQIYILNYEMMLQARGNQRLKAIYRVRLDTARLTATIHVQPGNSDVPDTGSAKCKII